MTPLQQILETYRSTAKTEREKGTYFEELIRTYFRYEARHADLYSDVWLFADWAKAVGTAQFGISANDTGIDLVANSSDQRLCFAPQVDHPPQAKIPTCLARIWSEADLFSPT